MEQFFCCVNLKDNNIQTCNYAGLIKIKYNNCIKYGITGGVANEDFTCCPISIFGGEV
ncbi:MAG: hypothetical protein RSB70_06300 [Clostridium sp.]